MRHDGLAGAPHTLGTTGLVCGRTEGEILFPDDASVSPRHAVFSSRTEAVVVEDLGSLNGTFVRLRAPRALANGDEVRLGRQRLRIEPQPRPAASGARPWGSVDPGYRARIVQLLEEGGTGEGFPLRAGENAVGREVGAVCFPLDRYVSARHARLDVSESTIWITDLGSSNGTFVRITEPTTLGAGDQVFVGMQLLRIER
jgi:pSer/pThr/pTyr-binding forkhead associated (FHA) protein